MFCFAIPFRPVPAPFLRLTFSSRMFLGSVAGWDACSSLRASLQAPFFFTSCLEMTSGLPPVFSSCSSRPELQCPHAIGLVTDIGRMYSPFSRLEEVNYSSPFAARTLSRPLIFFFFFSIFRRGLLSPSPPPPFPSPEICLWPLQPLP